MARKLVIGVGGTGLEVIRGLRRRILEDHPEEGLAAFPRLGFLYIDTDPNAIDDSEDNKKRWQVLGRSVQLSPNEHLIVQAPAIGRILENLDNFPQVRHWLPMQQLRGMNTAAKDTPGAQQIRALGRMIFTLQSDRIRQRIAAILEALPDEANGAPTEIHVACSLSGGTGGGMFLDLAYSLRRWTDGRVNTTGYLVMPDLNLEAQRGRRYVANAYGALLDLNYFSQISRPVDGASVPVGFRLPAEDVTVTGKTPFDVCYLLGTHNDSGVSLALSAVPAMISHRLYLTLDRAIVADVAGMMNNGAMERTRYLSDPVNGNQLSQAFSTFGLATIQYPTEQIVEIVSHRLAAALVESWSDATPVDNVNERVLQRLPDLQLIDDVFLGNRDIFQGANDFGPIANDVERQLNDALAKLPSSNRANDLNRINGTFLDEFRGGWKQFYRIRDDNREGAVQLLTRRVRSYAMQSIMDSALGLPFALAAVDDIIRLLNQKQQELSLRRDQVGPKVKNSRTGVTAAIGGVTHAESTIFRREAHVKEALTKVKAILHFNLTGQIEERALEYGVVLVGRLVHTITALRNELTEWASAMTVVRGLLAREIGRRAESLEALQKSSNQFNGSILFRSEHVEEVYAALNHREALQFIRDQIARNGEVLTLGQRPEDTVDELFRIAGDWLTRVSAIRVAHKNVADQLLKDFPGAENPERRQLIASTHRRSAPFLEFDQGETEIYRGRVGYHYEFDPTTATVRAAMMDHDQNRYPNVALIRSEIARATGLSGEDVRVTSDTHQIIFMSERTAFPLRVVRDVRTLRDAYRAYASQKESLPLLLQKEYTPPMGDLMLVSQAEVERLRRAETAFLVGWTLGWIRVEQNNIENRPEVRYRFIDAGSEQYQKVGDHREAALAFFTGEAPDTAPARHRLEDAVDRYIRKLDNYTLRAQLASALAEQLRQLRGEITYGEESPIYQRYNRIRQHAVTEFHLPEATGAAVTPGVELAGSAEPSAPGGAPGMNGGSATTASDGGSSAEAEFGRFVRLFMNQAAGKLTDRMSALIKSKQQSLRVSDERAATILREAGRPFVPSDDPLAEYRDMLAALLDVGDLTEHSIIELVAFQEARRIAPEQARQIEQEVRAKVGR